MATNTTAQLIEFFETHGKQDIEQAGAKNTNIYINYNDLERFNIDLADELIQNPETILETGKDIIQTEIDTATTLPNNTDLRLTNLPNDLTYSPRQFRAKHINTYISVEGVVQKSTNVKPRFTEATFQCQRCGEQQTIPQNEHEFEDPHICSGCERQGPFNLLETQSNYRDFQKIMVQEPPAELEGSEKPQSATAYLDGELTGDIAPGNLVEVTGILKTYQQKKRGQAQPVMEYFIDAKDLEIKTTDVEHIEVTETEREEIQELASQDDIYEKIIDSVAPTIFGYRDIKEAIGLQLFGGVSKKMPDDTYIRGDIHLLLIGDPGMGKCVKGDTKVLLSNGTEEPIRNLVESNLDNPNSIDDGVWSEVDFEVPSMLPNGEIGLKQATKVWKREAPEKMLKIRVGTGRELEATPTHPLFTIEDGTLEAKKASEIGEGDYVAVPNRVYTEGDNRLTDDYRRSESNNAVRLNPPSNLTPWLSRLIGYVVAEGHLQLKEDNSGCLYVCNADEEVLEDVKNILDKLGLNYSERDREGSSVSEVICASSELVQFFKALEPSMVLGSDEQRVPEAVMRSEKLNKSGFLKAYIDTEGYVASDTRKITVSSTSRELLEQVQTLLLSFRISSQVRVKGETFRLAITGEDYKRYTDEIGFITSRQTESGGSRKPRRLNTNTETIPSVGRMLKHVRNDLGLTQADCGIPRTTYQHYELGDRNPSRKSLRKVIDRFKETSQSNDVESSLSATSSIEHLEALVNADVSWRKVECVEEVEPSYDWVYDLEVEDTHNYISNNIVSHNSQLLRYVKNLSPRGVYTSGKSSSSAGLTAAATKDEWGDGRWTLEAGALVLADKGIAAVDELDKMKDSDRSALHEAMEQQCFGPTVKVRSPHGHLHTIGGLVSDLLEEKDTTISPSGKELATLEEGELEVMSVSTETGKIERESVNVVGRREAPDKMLRIKLSNRRTIEVTPEHPFNQFDGGELVTVEAKELEEGSHLLAPRRDELEELSEILSIEWFTPEYSYVYDITVPDNHNFLGEGVLLHNSVSIAKAGITTTLKTRCALLAAANPKHGRYDPHELIADQLDLEPALVSRFDLIFALKDKPDEDRDEKIGKHIVTDHEVGAEIARGEEPESKDEVEPPIEPGLMKKYISLAKDIVPKFSEEAKDKIVGFYQETRAGAEQGTIPITARQLEALVRLSEGSAKVRLSEEIEGRDADRAIKLVKETLEEFGVDPETGEYDIDTIATGTSKSQRDKARLIKNVIRDLQQEGGSDSPLISEVLVEAEAEGLGKSDAEERIEKMVTDGEAFKPSATTIRLT